MSTIMLVTTHGDGLHVSYPYDARVVARLKTIPGATWDKERRVWVVPAAQADRLTETFPKATFDYDAICASVAAQAGRGRAFYASMVSMGVALCIDASGSVYGVGENVSETLQECIRARSEALRGWVIGEGVR